MKKFYWLTIFMVFLNLKGAPLRALDELLLCGKVKRMKGSSLVVYFPQETCRGEKRISLKGSFPELSPGSTICVSLPGSRCQKESFSLKPEEIIPIRGKEKKIIHE
ncbi:hypothetical protein [Thermosulfurimonas sp. F29]|uniref:hypothetical protein n=1 Tax=Thermosulfurimonas sp. F29 TaxID=2867247 RepID=UPI001C82A5D8|nr:hypothetical protein [Thermosulfurimonas sp. F29]MBX6423043.1 hypothetical protein [Thermosulfurimonas sp. F29]